MSCLETYATLRIFSKSIEPEAIGAMLGISGASCRPIDPNSKYRSRREWGLWSWCTDATVESRDNLDHLRAITERLEGKAEQLAHLRAQDCKTDIFCYWISSGQGGPYLDTSTINALASLGLDIAWDMYFGDEANYNEDGSRKSPHGA